MQKKFRSWEQVLFDLSTTHTTSLTDICQHLKASRTWVSQYVMPHLDTIYLNNNIRYGQGNSHGANWVKIASIQLAKENMTESVWCNTKDFTDLIAKSIKSFTQQTKQIPFELLLTDVSKFQEEYDKLMQEYMAVKKRVEKSKNLSEIFELTKFSTYFEQLHRRMLTKQGKIIYQNLPNIIKRSDLERIHIPYTNIPEMSEWIAPHDIKDYGQTDELIYRNFCKNGYARIELCIETNGKIGQKIYYVPDPNPIKFRNLDKYITIKFSDYLKYFA